MPGLTFYIKSLQDTIPKVRHDSLVSPDSLSTKISLSGNIDTLKNQDSLKWNADTLLSPDTIINPPGTDSVKIKKKLIHTEQHTPLTDSIQKADSLLKKKPAKKKLPKKESFLPDTNQIIFKSETLRPVFNKNFLPHIQPVSVSDSLKFDFFIQENAPLKKKINPLLNTQLVNKRHFEVSGEVYNTPDWFICIFLLSLLILARVKFIYKKFHVPLFLSLFSFHGTRTLFRNKRILFKRTAFGLDLIFILNAGLFLTIIASFSGISFPFQWVWIHFFILTVIVVLWIGFKYTVCKLLGSYTYTQSIFGEYYFTFSLINKSLGLILLFLNIGIVYLDSSLSVYFIYTGIILILLFYIFRIFRLLIIFVSKSVSLLYAFLYLCTLEFLPILLLFRIIVPIGD